MQVDISCSLSDKGVHDNISIDRSVREVTPLDSHDKVMMAAHSNPNPNHDLETVALIKMQWRADIIYVLKSIKFLWTNMTFLLFANGSNCFCATILTSWGLIDSF